MATRGSGTEKKVTNTTDDFSDYLIDAKSNPDFRTAFEDAEQLHRIVDTLVQLRKDLGLSQSVVADRMGVRQPTVSGFETEGSDPRLSTLQRYARAVMARLRIGVSVHPDCDWVSSSTRTYVELVGGPLADPRPAVGSSDLGRRWKEAVAQTPETCAIPA